MAKAARKQKTKAGAPGAKGLIGLGHNRGPAIERSDEEVRRLFVEYHERWTKAIAVFSAARQQLGKIKAAAKLDGFKIRQLQIADDLNTITGEAKRTHEVDDILRVARWVGHPMGAQLDMFEQSSGTALRDSENQAFEDGKTASMRNQPRKPPDMYAPESEPYYGWFKGYDAHQRELAGGFKASSPKKPPARKAKSAKVAVADESTGFKERVGS